MSPPESYRNPNSAVAGGSGAARPRARRDRSDDAGWPNARRSWRSRSPLIQAAMLLGIYIAMYLAAAAVIRFLPLPDGVGRRSVAANSVAASGES